MMLDDDLFVLDDDQVVARLGRLLCAHAVPCAVVLHPESRTHAAVRRTATR